MAVPCSRRAPSDQYLEAWQDITEGSFRGSKRAKEWVANFSVWATLSAMILRQFPVKFAALLFSVTLSAAPLTGQRVPVGDSLEDYIRLLQVAGRAGLAPLSIRPLSRDRVLRSIDAEQTHPWQNRYSAARDEPQGVWYRFPDPKARAYWNSDHPVMRAEGAVWQGKGGTLQLAAGATLGYGPVTASFYPSFIVTQNRDFEIVEVFVCCHKCEWP